MDNNLIVLALLNDENLNGNIIGHLIEDLQEQLPHDFNIQRRGICEKNRNYYEEIILLYNNVVFKEYFRMSARAIQVCKFMC